MAVSPRYKGLERDRLRDKINAVRCLNRIEKCLDLLETGWQQLGPEEVNAQRAIMDGSFRLLSKVLPDLKAVEHKGEITSHVVVKFNP
jgi:hypothetical protein